MEPRDTRHFSRMRERISLYEADRIDLHTLINDLDFLLSSVDSVQLRRSLREEWAIIEEVYATSIDRRADLSDAIYSTPIEQALLRLKALLASQLTADLGSADAVENSPP